MTAAIENRFRSSYYFSFLLPALIFFTILVFKETPLLKTISVLARYNTTRLVSAVIVLLVIALSIKKPRLSNFLTALVIFPLFSLALNGLWASAYSENYVIAGLLPRSDAFLIYTGALNLLERGFLENIAERRPIFGAFLTFILWAVNGNLQAALAAIAFLSATACFLAVIEVKRLFGLPAAVVFFIVQYLFIRRFVGITMTENMGFILGISAFAIFIGALLMRMEDTKRGLPIFLFALLLFTLAQAARPGGVVALPSLAALAGWLWKKERKFSWNVVILAILVIAAGFLINSLIFSLFSGGRAVQTSNWGYGVYGLAAGGKGWEQIFTDHPEINSLQAGIREKRIIQIVLNEIISHPGNFLKGLAYQFSICYLSSRLIYLFLRPIW